MIEDLAEERPMNDVDGAVIFRTQSSVVNFRRGLLVVLPLQLPWENVPPPRKGLVKSIAQDGSTSGVVKICSVLS